MTQLIEDFANRLSQNIPCCYHNFSPLLATYVSSNYSTINCNGFEIGEMDTIQYAALQSQIMYEQTLEGLIDSTKQNIAQMVTLAYFGMQKQSYEANESNWYAKLKGIIDIARQPGHPIIIASYGVDLYTLSIHCKLLSQQNGAWYLNNDRVYEMTLLCDSPQQDSSFVVLSKKDAPFFDFDGQFEKPWTIPSGGITTKDVYHSLGIFVGQKVNNNKNYLKVKPLIPLLYHPTANIYTLKIKIEYDNV